MTRIQRYIMRWLLNQLIQRSEWYKSNIREVYKLVREQSRTCFYEDNDASLDAFLQEIFDETKMKETA